MKVALKTAFLLVMACLHTVTIAQTKDSTSAVLPAILKSARFDGAIKTKMEMSTDDGMMRFNVRNSRIGVRGNIGRHLGYRVQVELSNEGTFSPLDLYGTLNPSKNLSFNFGQTQVPFENNYITTPAEMMFANRAFVGKFFTPGSRDIGMVAMYKFHIDDFPMEGQAGMFNGGRINDPQWTDRPSYAFRLIAGSMDGLRSTAKVYKYSNELSEQFFWGVDVHYANPRLRVEAEVMNRHSDATERDLLGGYLQGGYTFGLAKAKIFHSLTPAARWDAMGYNVPTDGFDVNRLTVGINFGLTFIPYNSILRIDYEQYFVHKDLVFPDFDNRDDPHVADNKVTMELVIQF